MLKELKEIGKVIGNWIFEHYLEERLELEKLTRDIFDKAILSARQTVENMIREKIELPDNVKIVWNNFEKPLNDVKKAQFEQCKKFWIEDLKKGLKI